MPEQQQLFSVPIEPLGTAHPGGAITCTRPRAPDSIYLLTWTSPPDNRITTPFCKALLAALDVLEFGGYEPGVVITTSGIAKFYSNGLDLEHAIGTDGFWPLFYSVWKRFLTYVSLFFPHSSKPPQYFKFIKLILTSCPSFPMPTIALLNGHTFAGGLMLSMSHDYRLAPSPKGYLCLNEVLFGAPLKPAMAAIFRHKLPNSSTLRTVALEAKRMSGADAVALGVADGTCARGVDDALALIDERKLLEMPKAGVYGVIKGELYKDLIAELAGAGLEAEEKRFVEDAAAEDERREFGKVWYEQWVKDKAKL